MRSITQPTTEHATNAKPKGIQRGTSYGKQQLSNTFYNQSTSDFNEYHTDAQDDFARQTYFDKSAAFGMSDDKLGRLAEINRQQID